MSLVPFPWLWDTVRGTFPTVPDPRGFRVTRCPICYPKTRATIPRHKNNFRYGSRPGHWYARIWTAKQDLTRQLDALGAEVVQ